MIPLKIKGLTIKEIDFLEEWYKNGKNGTRAYMKVNPGAAYNTSATEAGKILKKPEVIEFIKENIDLQIERMILSEMEIKEMLSNIASGGAVDKTQCFDKDGNTIFSKEGSKTSDRIKALELMGKTTAMFIDNNKFDGSAMPVTFVNDIPKETDDIDDN